MTLSSASLSQASQRIARLIIPLAYTRFPDRKAPPKVPSWSCFDSFDKKSLTRLFYLWFDFQDQHLLATPDFEDEERLVGGDTVFHVRVEHNPMEVLHVGAVVRDLFPLFLKLLGVPGHARLLDRLFDHVKRVVVIGGEAEGRHTVVVPHECGLESVPARVVHARVDVVVDLDPVDIVASDGIE